MTILIDYNQNVTAIIYINVVKNKYIIIPRSHSVVLYVLPSYSITL